MRGSFDSGTRRVTAIAIYIPENRELDLSALSVADYEMVKRLHGVIRRGDNTLLCKRASGDREMSVFKVGNNYFARHFPGGAHGHGSHRISRISDEHLRGTECWMQAWSDAGFGTASEVTTDNHVRLDAVAFADTVTALETQVQPQSAAVVKGRHTKRLRARSFTGAYEQTLDKPLQVVWFAPIGRPDWLYQVPTVECGNQSWQVTPDPKAVTAIGVRSLDVKPCSNTWFARCPDRRFGWCGKPHLWMQLAKGLTIADVATMVPSGELLPVRMPSGIFLTDRRSYARSQSFGYRAPSVPELPQASRPPTACDWTGHYKPPEPIVDPDPHNLGPWVVCAGCKKKYRPASSLRRCYDCRRMLRMDAD